MTAATPTPRPCGWPAGNHVVALRIEQIVEDLEIGDASLAYAAARSLLEELHVWDDPHPEREAAA